MVITAHSGCDGTPDNSMQYLRHALRLPLDAIELDVRRRADGLLVVWHDHDPTGRYPGRVPLEEALALSADYPGTLNCDLKEPGLEEDVCRLHARLRRGPLVLSGSIDPRLWYARPGLHAQAQVYLNAEEVVAGIYEDWERDPATLAAAARALAEACRACGIGVVNVDHRICSRAFIADLGEQGIGVSAWTVDDLDRAKRLRTDGVANITTRNATLFLEYFR